jgi:ABC-type transporter Mla MlaB component
VQKSQAEITQQNQQKYIISGTVDFSTVPDLLRKTSGFISETNSLENKPIMIDLSGVIECNSAAIGIDAGNSEKRSAAK